MKHLERGLPPARPNCVRQRCLSSLHSIRSRPPTLRGLILITAGAAILAACGKSPTSELAASAGASPGPRAPSSVARASEVGESGSSASAGNVAGAGGKSLASSRGGSAAGAGRELVNPDAATVVLLYYQLAHLPLPIDAWVEEDNRVRFAPAPEKAAHRESVRAELAAAAAAVQGVGSIRLTMNANLSDYDPSYGEFTVRALSPSSVINFDSLGQKVALNFTNGRTAQIWRVPPADAQGIRDRISYNGNVEIDVLLRIADVLPGPGGGTIATDVLEYELRETQRGAVLARVQLNNPREQK